jgi:hypothetical protein
MKSKFQHTGTRWLQHDRSAACVIAQQCSYASFVSLPFHAGKEKFSSFQILFFCFFAGLKFRKSEIAYIEMT